VVNASLFVRKGFHQIKEAIEIGDHGELSPDEKTLRFFADWVKHVYKSHFF
jgi:hypothetical protein